MSHPVDTPEVLPLASKSGTAFASPSLPVHSHMIGRTSSLGHVHELQSLLDVLLLFLADQGRAQDTIHKISEWISLAERTVLSTAKIGRV